MNQMPQIPNNFSSHVDLSAVAIKFNNIGSRLEFELTTLYKIFVSCGGDIDVLYDLRYSSGDNMDDRILYTIIIGVSILFFILSVLFFVWCLKKAKRVCCTSQHDLHT